MRMETYTVKCSCGHDLKVNARSREEAVEKAKKEMDEKGIEEHYAQYHEGEPVPSVGEVHQHIEEDIMATPAM